MDGEIHYRFKKKRIVDYQRYSQKKKQREKVRDSDMAQLSYLSEKGNERGEKKTEIRYATYTTHTKNSKKKGRRAPLRSSQKNENKKKEKEKQKQQQKKRHSPKREAMCV